VGSGRSGRERANIAYYFVIRALLMTEAYYFVIRALLTEAIRPLGSVWKIPLDAGEPLQEQISSIRKEHGACFG
jgi:hypothetical protein